MVKSRQLLAAWQKAREALLDERAMGGHWVGELSSSALSTATAVSALALVRRRAAGLESIPAGAGSHVRFGSDFRWKAGTTDGVRSAPATWDAGLGELIVGGLHWLADAQNADGGWGDTDRSHSNIATTMLVRAAFHLTGVPARHAGLLERAAAYIEKQGGIPGLRRRYGKDKTFAVPILTNCALAGLAPWSEVSALPFELACLPQSWYRFLRLPVVSYAIPALVAIGQARFFHRPPWNPIVRSIRHRAVDKSLEVLERMQPASGGFLEATPLTSFVVMSLASIGRVEHPVVERGVRFLVESVRPDGSWPIDTNLATWNTTLAINALRIGEEVRSPECGVRSYPQNDATPHFALRIPHSPDSAIHNPQLLDWLLSCQNRQVHPYTGSDPGGWGWSDLSGSVPDADDTPGALLALSHLASESLEVAEFARIQPVQPRPNSGEFGYVDESVATRIDSAAEAGIAWLLDLQNSDGGWPTFCRGWGTMPFDRSGSDLTAHALRALYAWRARWVGDTGVAPGASGTGVPPVGHRRDAGATGVDQRDAGATVRTRLLGRIHRAIDRGLRYLAGAQRPDGSWVPLWFGNQDHPDEENPVYGTARVLLAYRDLDRIGSPEALRGLAWLAAERNLDGGWGGSKLSAQPPQSSVEETALAVEALLAAPLESPHAAAAWEGVSWLIEAVENDSFREPAPIGFYFAKLWYYERLYPLIFTVSALGQAAACCKLQPRVEAHADSSPAQNALA
jgi:squalene-hopene/tetraprenyl-beta-curcumene cyclase